MKEKHLDARQVARLRFGDLRGAEVIAMTTHLASCEACEDSAPPDVDGNALETLEHLLEDSADDHPDVETQLTGFVDGTLPFDEHERVEAHLGICERCREDVDDLRQVAASMARARGFGSRGRFMLAVAAAIIVAIITLVLAFRSKPQGEPPPARTRVIRTTPPTPAESPMKPEWAAMIRDAVSSGRIAMPKVLRAITAPQETVRGEMVARRDVVSPAEEVVETDRPTFTWSARKAKESVVFVYRGDDEVAVSGRLHGNTWTPQKPLPRATPLVWQVELRNSDGTTTIVPAPPDPPAIFRIIDEASQREIDEARRLHPGNDLLLGVLYARAGLKSRAIEALRHHTAEHPETRPLLQSVENWH